jgi:glucan biosynthesis protein C
LWLKKRSPNVLTLFLSKPGAVYLLALPVVLTEFLGGLDPGGLGRREFGGWNLLSYLVFLILGFLIVQDRRIVQSIEKHRWVSLAFGLVLVGIEFVFYLSGQPLSGIAGHVVRAYTSWFLLTAILGMGSRFLRLSNRFLSYANEAVLPFYILHQTVIVVFAFFLIEWPAAVLVKYLVLVSAAFALTFLLYEFLVRRSNILRFLFGMTARRP